MNRIVIVLAALVASAAFVPAAQAMDCDPDDVADVAACMRGMMKMPSVKQALPPAPRLPSALKEECDADSPAELKACMRGMKGPGPVAAPPAEKKLPEKSATPSSTPAPVASSKNPATPAGAEEPRLCQQYFASIGQTIAVPCPAKKRDTADDARVCQKYFPNIDQMVTVPCRD
jgi:hypothetical protein